MGRNDERARRKRAEALRRKIEGLKTGAGPVGASRPETPAEFVHRRMRELDRGAALSSATEAPKRPKPHRKP